jgi:uncharacterized protein DUF5654
MAKVEAPDKIGSLPYTVIKNIVSLSTSGFGLVVALAWNEVIRTAVKEYLDPILGKDGSIISLGVYAIVITTLAVLFTMQLARIEQRIGQLSKKRDTKEDNG